MTFRWTAEVALNRGLDRLSRSHPKISSSVRQRQRMLQSGFPSYFRGENTILHIESLQLIGSPTGHRLYWPDSQVWRNGSGKGILLTFGLVIHGSIRFSRRDAVCWKNPPASKVARFPMPVSVLQGTPFPTIWSPLAPVDILNWYDYKFIQITARLLAKKTLLNVLRASWWAKNSEKLHLCVFLKAGRRPLLPMSLKSGRKTKSDQTLPHCSSGRLS